MARRTHRKLNEEEVDGKGILRKFCIYVPPPVAAFLEVEAKKASEKKGKLVKPTDIVKALIAAYYEKRVAGLLVSPDD
jgi:hypothetical protein